MNVSSFDVSQFGFDTRVLELITELGEPFSPELYELLSGAMDNPSV